MLLVPTCVWAQAAPSQGSPDLDQPAPNLSAPEPADDMIRSALFGFELDVRSTHWHRSDALEALVPDAHAVALREGGAAVVVVPVALPPVEIDTTTLVRVMCAHMGLPSPDHAAVEPQEQLADGTRSRVIHHSVEQDGVRFSYRMRLLRRKHSALWVTAWVQDGPHTSPDWLKEAQALCRLTPEPQAVTPDALTAQERQVQAQILARCGQSLFEADRYAPSATIFQHALAFSPTDATLLGNAALTLSVARRDLEARALLDHHMTPNTTDADLLALSGAVYLRLGQKQKAIGDYEKAFAAGCRDADALEAFVDLLWDHGAKEQAMATTEGFLETTPSRQVLSLLASLFTRQGDHEAAVRLLEAERRDRLPDPRLLHDLANSYQALGEHDKAITICRQLIENAAASVRTYMIKGRSELKQRRLKQAKASFELALAEHPEHEAAQRYVDYVTHLLGQNENRIVRHPITPVDMPPGLSLSAPLEANDTYLDGFGAYYVWRAKLVAWRAGEKIKTTEHATIKVVDGRGVDQFREVQLPFDPQLERIFINQLAVKAAQGNVVSVADGASSYVLDERGHRVVQNRRVLHAPVSGVQDGCTIELVVTRQDKAATARLPLLEHIFSGDHPVGRHSLVLLGDTDQCVYEQTGELAFTKTGRYLSWQIDRPPVYTWEPYQPAYQAYLPTVWVGDSAATWQQLGHDYLARIGNRLDPNQIVAAMAGALILGIESAHERTSALARFVQETIGYKAIQFGQHARIPEDVQAVLANRYGDCKDQSLLLHHLLRSLGIRSHLALVNSSGGIRPGVPSLDHFNHMVVYCPGDERFIDCTDKTVDLGQAHVPDGMAGQFALILDPRSPSLRRIPAYGEGASSAQIQRQLSLIGPADLLVRERVTLRGYHASRLRNHLAAVDPHRLEAVVRHLVGSAETGLTIDRMNVRDLQATERPLVIEMDYRLADRFQAVAGRLVGRLPALWEQHLLHIPPQRKRVSPLRLRLPLQIDTQVEFALPHGFVLDGQVTTRQEKSPALNWSIAGEGQLKVLKLRYNGRRHEGTYAAGEFGRVFAGVKEALSKFAHPVILIRDDAFTPPESDR